MSCSGKVVDGMPLINRRLLCIERRVRSATFPLFGWFHRGEYPLAAFTYISRHVRGACCFGCDVRGLWKGLVWYKIVLPAEICSVSQFQRVYDGLCQSTFLNVAKAGNQTP